MLDPESGSGRRIPGYEVKVAENRVGVASVGLGTTILFSALTALGLPRSAWAVAAGIGTALLVYALLVESPPEDGTGSPASAQYNDGGSGPGDRFFINQVNFGLPQPKEGDPESTVRGIQEEDWGGKGEGD